MFGWEFSYCHILFSSYPQVRFFELKDLPDGSKVDEQRIGRLTGLLAAAFSFAQFTTSLLWGLISNLIGRKVCVAWDDELLRCWSGIVLRLQTKEGFVPCCHE